MSDVLPSATRLFLKCCLLQRQVLGQRIQRSIFCVESLAVQSAVACVWLVAKSQGIVDRWNSIPQPRFLDAFSLPRLQAVESSGKSFTSQIWTAHSILHKRTMHLHVCITWRCAAQAFRRRLSWNIFGSVDWFRRQWPGVGRKNWAATKGKTTSISEFVYIMLTSAALGSGVAGHPELRSLLPTLTDSRSSGRMVLAR